MYVSTNQWLFKFVCVSQTRVTQLHTTKLVLMENSRGTPSPDRDCALDADGNLMDASRINFFNSPSDEHPISGPNITQLSPTPVAAKTIFQRPQRNSNQSKYQDAIISINLPGPRVKPARKRKRKNVQNDSDSDSQLISTTFKKKPGPKTKPNKAKAAANSAVSRFLKKPEDIASALHATTSASGGAPSQPEIATAVTTPSTRTCGSQAHENNGLGLVLPPTLSHSPRSSTPSPGPTIQTPPTPQTPVISTTDNVLDLTSARTGAAINHESGADVAANFRRTSTLTRDGKEVKNFECSVCVYVALSLSDS